MPAPTPIAQMINFENTAVAFSHLNDAELKNAYRLFKLLDNRFLADLGAKATALMLKVHLPIESLVKKIIYEQFCGGETLNSSIPKIQKLNELGVKTTLDYGIEGKSGEIEYERVLNEKIRMLNFAHLRKDIVSISCKPTGIADLKLFKRMQAGKPLSSFRIQQLEKVKARFYRLCKAAYDHKIKVYIDAEESWIQDPIDEITNELMQEFNKKEAIVSNTFQFYRTDQLDFLKASYEKARSNGYVLGAKLVRGAYMEKERKRANRKGYPCPIHADKNAVDKEYDTALEFCAERFDTMFVCNATHNEESCKHFAKLISKNGISPNHPNLWTGQLYGMGEHITFNLAKAGFNVFKLIPYGPVREVVPYLTRRAEENTSVGGQMSRELKLLKKEMKRRGL